MAESSAALERTRPRGREAIDTSESLIRQGILKLLAVKDSDVRILTLEQAPRCGRQGPACRRRIFRRSSAGDALLRRISFSGRRRSDPRRRRHVRAQQGPRRGGAGIDLRRTGLLRCKVLKNSRSHESILNGHPGPVLPGIHLATGPMGQGFGVAQGFAIAGRFGSRFDSYALLGDGELQEGPIWEAVMYAGAKRLDNLCILVDHNHGQLDIYSRLIFPMPELGRVFESFGWQAETVDATKYDAVYAALERFHAGPRNGKPTAIICHSTKGYGAFSDFFNRHKVVVTDSLVEQEIALQSDLRAARVREFNDFHERLVDNSECQNVRAALRRFAERMHLSTQHDSSGAMSLRQIVGPVVTGRVPPRNKRVRYDAGLLPKVDPSKEYSAADIVTGAMKIFARDPAVVSVDSDLATTSGLEAGVGAVDQSRALNVGVAEANMMGIGEAFAALGYNAWVSTFCPFFDWKVLRRIAVGHQERLEAMDARDGWLSEGHGLDLTFLATAANFETRTNGATHMGNDDITVFDAIGHLKIIDVSCPRQMLAVMQWIMDGNRGLIYLRVMRTPSAVIYGPDYSFEFGKGQVLRRSAKDAAVIVSSGRGVHEALAAEAHCAKFGVSAGVVDMPSLDDALLLELFESGTPIVFAEQNNGYIWQNFLKALYRHRKNLRAGDLDRVTAINALDPQGRPRFIHSGTYEELIEVFGLSAARLARRVMDLSAKGGNR